MSAKIHHRRCTRCRMKYELLEHRDGTYALSRHVESNHLVCPRCDWPDYEDVIGTPNFSIHRPEPTLPRAPDVGENALSQHHFPYYDYGLGAMLQSPEHRQWLMTHEKDGTLRDEPLVCVGEDRPWDPIAIVDHEIAHTKEVHRRYDAYKDEMLAHPDTRQAWHYCETAIAAQDLSHWGVDRFPGPASYPPEGETILQDLDGYLYTDSGWVSDDPQPWVPLSLAAAGHTPRLPDSESTRLLLEG